MRKALLHAAVLLTYGVLPLYSQSESVGGTVIALNGMPMAGVPVQAKPEGTNSAGLSLFVTRTDDFGKYKFENLPPGAYNIRAGADDGAAGSHRAFFNSTTVSPEGRVSVELFRASESTDSRAVIKPDLVGPARITVPGAANLPIDLVMLPAAFTLSGHIANPARTALPALKLVLTGTMTGTASKVTEETVVPPDGAFEFSDIPPGSYMLRLNPNLGVPPTAITVSDQNRTGIELGGRSGGVRVSGHVLPSDRSIDEGKYPQSVYLVGQEAAAIPPPSSWPTSIVVVSNQTGTDDIPQSVADLARYLQSLPRIIFTAPIETILAPVGPDGRFEFLSILPGSYSIRTLPEMGLPNTRITVAGDVDIANVIVGAGVRVRGEVVRSNFGTRPPELIKLTLAETNVQGATAIVNEDGTFEFPKIGQGTYQILLDNKVKPTVPEITVGKDEIIIRVEAPFKPWVAGRVTFTGPVPAPEALAAIHVALSNGYPESGVQPDGSFRLPSNNGEYGFVMKDLPDGYSIKSVNHGSEDLMKAPLKVDSSIPASEILVTLEYKPVTPQ